MLNTLSLFTSLVEDPEAKNFCLLNLNQLDHLQDKNNFSKTSEYVDALIKQIKWKP
jgi:hypothetical protein